MKNFLIIPFLLFTNLQFCYSQEMDNEKLQSIIYTISDEMQGDMGRWEFVIDSTYFMCLTDEVHNRMRIISPVKTMDEVTQDQLEKCMEANFHTALDVKYAISDSILWSAYIHPLKELSKDQTIDAIKQIYSAVHTFGSYYSSGNLQFPSSESKEEVRPLQKN